jgi:hypothetical protein
LKLSIETIARVAAFAAGCGIMPKRRLDFKARQEIFGLWKFEAFLNPPSFPRRRESIEHTHYRTHYGFPPTRERRWIFFLNLHECVFHSQRSRNKQFLKNF